MTDLVVPMNMKRKDVEVMASHGFSIFLDPKRIKLQLQDGKIVDVMEEDEPLSHAPASTATAPTIVHDKVNLVSGGKFLEPPSRFSNDQDAAAAAAAPMDMEEDAQQQRQPSQGGPFFSGFF